jgi:uncharacterized protein
MIAEIMQYATRKSVWATAGLALLVLASGSADAADTKAPYVIVGEGRSAVKLEVAQNELEIQHGLMDRTSMPEDSGMVFLFDPPRPVNFWMYHTLIPLDMLFIKNGKIVKLFENVPPCKSEDPKGCPTYPEGPGIEVTEVVEVNGGYAKRHKVKEGQQVFFTLNPSRTLGKEVK